MIDRNQAMALYEQFAKMANALNNPHRLRLLNLLSQCERTVESLADTLKLSIAIVSHHLQRLRRVRLVVSRKVGRHVTYAIADAEVTAFWLYYQNFCRGRLAELQLLGNAIDDARKARGRVDRESLQQMLAKGDTVLWDLRPQLEFDAGHLPGAVSCPFGALAECIKSAPTDKTVVLYCRGPYCVLGDMAQEQLATRGIKALLLVDGVPEWASAGLPVKQSANYHSLFSPS
jgi:rhodanese-related sulfurtransferase